MIKLHWAGKPPQKVTRIFSTFSRIISFTATLLDTQLDNPFLLKILKIINLVTTSSSLQALNPDHLQILHRTLCSLDLGNILWWPKNMPTTMLRICTMGPLQEPKMKGLCRRKRFFSLLIPPKMLLRLYLVPVRMFSSLSRSCFCHQGKCYGTFKLIRLYLSRSFSPSASQHSARNCWHLHITIV